MLRCSSCFQIIDSSMEFCPYCGHKQGGPAKEPYQLPPGTPLTNRYIVGGVLGTGGFGITYRAWDKTLDMIVALKEYYPRNFSGRAANNTDVVAFSPQAEKMFLSFKERFLNEARNMAMFSSEKNIVNVYEFFEANNTAYIAMEYLDGIELNKYMRINRTIELDYAIDIISQTANALSKLHEKGIIHRDISPDNIHICKNGTVKLIDFGAARFSGNETQMMTVMLKNGFAPPEQYERINKQGPWTDIYALGATLYFILTRKKPVKAPERAMNDTLPYPHELDPNIPEYVSNSIMKAMSLDIDLRFKSVKDFVAALHRDKTVLPVVEEEKKRHTRRNVQIAAVAAVIVLAAAGFAVKFAAFNKNGALPKCTISMWYCKSGDEEADSREEKAYSDIISNFNKTFPDVTVELEGYDSGIYAELLEAEENQPNLYEYMGDEACSDHLSLESIFEEEKTERCTLLSQVRKAYGNYNYIPLGFNAPAVFFNTDYAADDQKGFSAGDTGGRLFVTDDAAITQTFPEAELIFNENASEQFYDKTAAFYGTSTKNYFEISEKMTGHYRLMYCDAEKVCCKYDNVWTANDMGRKQNKAALKLLEYMYSEDAQELLHVRYADGSFPVNDDVLELYSSIYSDYEGFFDNQDNYILER